MKVLSVRARIVVGFVVLTAVLLTGFASTVYLRARSARLTALDSTLAARAAALAALVENDHGEWEAEFAGEMMPSAALLGSAVGYEVFIHADDELLARSLTDGVDTLGGATLPVHVPPHDSIPDERPHELAHHVQSVTLPCSMDARVFTGLYVINADWEGWDEDRWPAAPVARIVLAEDLAPIHADLRGLLGTLALIGALTLALSVAAGWLLSRRIVDPLAAIADAADRIQTTDPGGRILGSGSGDEIDRLTDALNRAFSRLLDAYARQARFTADASHELRTPVTIIRTQAEVALRRTRSVEEYRDALTAVVEGSGRMQETIEGLLLLARADAGAFDSSRERTDLHEVVRGALADVATGARTASVELIHETGDPVRVEGDPRQLRMAVRNLLSNAVRHSPEGSTVRVAVSVAGDEIHIRVADQGEGIAPDQIAHVFDRFYRADKARSRARGGAGLGLSIVQLVAEQHGGRVSIHSEPGMGTTVTITLPASN